MVTRGIVWPSCDHSACPHPDPVIEYPENIER
jgi:hypothetical protein